MMNTIESLINSLIWGPKEIKEKSAIELAKIGEPAIDHLLPLLSHEDGSVRILAALTLCDIGDGRLLDQFITFLKDNSTQLKKKAIEAIGKIGDPKTIDYLIGLFNDRDVHIRLSAIEALIKIGNASIEKLLNALKDESEVVRESAVYALGKIMDEETIPRLLPLLSDKNIYVRMAAAQAIANKGVIAIKTLVNLLKDKNETVREASTYALGEIGDKKTVSYIIEMLSDKDPFVKISAARALGKIGDERAVEPLLKLISEENAFVSMSAANALKELKENVFAHLLQSLTYTNPVIRKSAARALGKIGDERAIIPLILALWDENEEVTSSVVEALYAIDSYWYVRDEIRQYIPYFSEALKKGGKHVKLSIIDILEKICQIGMENDEIEGILKDYIKDEDKNVRQNAALALEKIRKKEK